MSFPIIWSGNFYHLRHSCSYKLLRFQSGSTPKILPDTRTCNLRFLASKAEGKNQKSQSKKPQNVNVNHNDGSVKSSSSKTINKSELHEFKAVQCYQHISEKRVFDWPAVVIAFDIETTGLSRQKERIIEIALRDLYGGKNSTFQTLVNPEKEVSNSYIHGIRSDMVNRPDVPRFKELVPILLQYIRSRQTDGRQVALFAHNGRGFDVPFLIHEFRRCKVEIPEDWLFVDTLPLARKLVKPDGSKLESSKLDDLRQYYEIPLIGPAHRAMQDVHTLAYVLQKMSYQLKLSIPELLDGGFRASDIIKVAP
ncbi:uncharacterized protein A4U43_C07F13460 [Asparagus officinalis]|uniref:Exonuclease domain-containing protein n=1 Tax=Asparagus officinalis TaxID=4686 RepID=A0A5P1EBR0_ASPOF|nr:exonuclease DPD1, chloroplastic/mitochondrial [Asparagus officinalis]XP_020273906.1 exonuclease DPD1, chloroplastic/mitochondrial [Asparagus officinalis]ONK63292.1 uncharacterized protein A4U43_C07F13460 [Asparagus officinalis]